VTGPKLRDFVLRAAGASRRFAADSDGDLLGRFVADRDATAFAELVRRHGAMVLGVAGRELGNTPDADDVCQATFLVLARRASAVRRADAVGAWLYGVARRVARKQYLTTSRRRHREAPLADLPGPDTTASASLRDGLRVLDEELARLPDAYRAPLVLCYLEGRTQDEAAKQLGWSLGAFRGRLERGRARLRDRLTRRGVGLAILAAAAAARPAAASAAVQTSIINTAAAVAAGEAFTLPESVAALAEGAIRAMTMSKIQWGTGVAAVCGMLAVGGVWATGQVPGGLPPGAPPPFVAPSAPVAGVKTDAPGPRSAGASQRRKSLQNLKQIMLAIHNYHDANGHLPADIRDQKGDVLLSWRVAILPYLEQDAVYRQFKLDEPWDSEHNLKLLQQMPATYRVGIEPKDSTHTHYQVFAGPGRNVPLHVAGGRIPRGPLNPAGALPAGPPGVRIADIVDGTSYTLGVVEAAPPVPWTKPVDLLFDPKTPKVTSPFSNEWHAAMMDGSVYALKTNLDPDILRRLIIMNDGEPEPPLNRLLAPKLAETPQEKAKLRELVERNQQLADEVHQRMREFVETLAGNEGRPGDLGAMEELGEELQQMSAKIRSEIKKLKGEPETKPAAKPAAPITPERGR
jgi:RNA polymerase sigma factor (sigma-70 family)